MLPRRNRLTSAQFERAFGQSQVVRHPLVQARAHRRDDGTDEVRAAFVVPKKQGKAHDRNRTKRRLRERFRVHPRRDGAALQGCDLIFMATPATAAATLGELDAALDEVLRRLGKRMNSAPDSSPPQGERRDVAGASVASSEAPAETDSVASGEAQTESSPEKTASGVKFREAPVSWLFIETIRFYQRAISPGLPPSCRFFPSCSAYTALAIERHGPFWGVVLGTWRICRCTPLCKGGFDPVPDKLSPRFSSPFLGLFPKK